MQDHLRDLPSPKEEPERLRRSVDVVPKYFSALHSHTERSDRSVVFFMACVYRDIEKCYAQEMMVTFDNPYILSFPNATLNKRQDQRLTYL
jgi:hypothetical protein